METFADAAQRHRVRTLAVFGDSITEGAGASSPERSWASLLALKLGARLINRGIGGTVLRGTPVHDGRGGSGISRYHADLLGQDRADCIALLYGYNDARYTADPAGFNVAAFDRDYRVVLDGLLGGGFQRDRLCVGSPPYIPDEGLQRGGPGFTGQTRAGFELYVEAARNLARDYGVFYAPVYEDMAHEPDGALASPDWIHPGDAGHAVIADAFVRAIAVS